MALDFRGVDLDYKTRLILIYLLSYRVQTEARPTCGPTCPLLRYRHYRRYNNPPGPGKVRIGNFRSVLAAHQWLGSYLPYRGFYDPP